MATTTTYTGLRKTSADEQALATAMDVARNQAIASKNQAQLSETNTATLAAVDGAVAAHADLPPAASHNGEQYLVHNDESQSPIRHKAVYESDGANWTRIFDGLDVGVVSGVVAGKAVDIITDIRALPGTALSQAVYATRAIANGPVVNALYVSDPSDTTSTDDGVLIVAGSDGVRWKLQPQGGAYDVRLWGVTGSGSDEQAQIQAAASSGAGVIRIPEGVSIRIESTVTLQNNQIWLGPGTITVPDGHDFKLFDCDGLTGVVISGIHFTAGTTSTQRAVTMQSGASKCVVTDCTFTNFWSAFVLSGATDCICTNNRIYNSTFWGINVQTGSERNIISGNIIDTVDNEHGIYLAGGGSIGTANAHNVVTGNTIKGTAIEGIKVDNFNYYNTISNNTLINCAGQGIRLSLYAEYNVVSGNTIDTPGANGIMLWDGPGGTSRFNVVVGNTVTDSGGSGVVLLKALDNVVSGNTVYNATTYGILFSSGGSKRNVVSSNVIDTTAEHGIYMSGGVSTVNEDNIITSNQVLNSASTKDGIRLTSYAIGNVVSNNHVENAGAQGISLSINADRNVVSGNTIKDATNNGIQLFASTGTCKHNVVTGNVLYSCGGYGISLSGASFNVVGFNETESNTTGGIVVSGATNNNVAYNVLVSEAVGIQVAGDSGGNHIDGNQYDSCTADLSHSPNAGFNNLINGAYLKSVSGWNPGALIDGRSATLQTTVTGAAVGDHVQVAYAGNPGGALVYGEVSSANTVNMYVRNLTGGSVTLNGTYKVRVVPAGI